MPLSCCHGHRHLCLWRGRVGCCWSMLLPFFGSLSKADGCPSLSSWGLDGAGAVVVDAMVEGFGWWLMRNGFLVLGKGLRSVWGLIFRNSSNSSARCSGSDLFQNILFQRSSLGVQILGQRSGVMICPLRITCSFVTLWLESRCQTLC